MKNPRLELLIKDIESFAKKDENKYKELAEKSGVTTVTLWRIRTGKNKPNMQTEHLIRVALNKLKTIRN
jgi:transcriptional regulator with XRE-family HTH domain